MKPPSLRVVILGHPLTVLVVMGVAAYRCWLCSLDATNGTVGLAVAAVWLAWRMLKDFDQRRRYRAWRRDCMAIAGEAGGSAAKRPRWLMGVAILPGVWVGIASQCDRPGAVVALGVGVVVALLTVVLIAKLAGSAWRFLRRERPKLSRPVAVAIGRALLPVPSLNSAYRSLPPYCATLFKDRA
jgi:hypothetical protein